MLKFILIIQINASFLLFSASKATVLLSFYDLKHSTYQTMQRIECLKVCLHSHKMETFLLIIFLKFRIQMTTLLKWSAFTQINKNDYKCCIMHARPVVVLSLCKYVSLHAYFFSSRLDWTSVSHAHDVTIFTNLHFCSLLNNTIVFKNLHFETRIQKFPDTQNAVVV